MLVELHNWRDEPQLQQSLVARGIAYSRFVDDISVSSKESIATEEKTMLIAAIYGMMQRNGYQPKRRKHELSTAKRRMSVPRLNINAKARIPKEERSRIRASVQRLELMNAEPLMAIGGLPLAVWLAK